MKKRIMSMLLLVTAFVLLAACGSKDVIEVWVGIESQAFYQEKAEEYIAAYNEANDTDFPVPIEVKAVDTGTAAGVFLNDPTSAGDIITVAHDNLGKLVAGSSAISPITSQSLIQQINDYNHQTYVDVSRGEVQGETYYFGVPYVGQSLILYYNKKYIDSEQVKTWEGILDAATTAEKQALSLSGTDGFNNSFVLLSVDNDTGTSSLKLYDNGDIQQNDPTGADVLSAIKWGQYLFTHPNGAKRPTELGWVVELTNEQSLAVIGGAWHFEAAKSALDEDLGIAILPTFTLTNDTVYDVDNNPELVGKVMRSGTFADVKMFVKNKVSKHAALLDDILEFFASKEVQEESLLAANNLPSYKDAVTEFDALNPETSTLDPLEMLLVSAQIEMFEFGRPQPFGFHPNFNFYFYSKQGPERLLEVLEKQQTVDGEKVPAFLTDAALLAEMKIIQNIWKTGKVDGE